MPREINAYNEAASQGLLWAPDVLNPGVFVDATDTGHSLSASGYTSIRNRGNACGFFAPQSNYFAAFRNFFGIPSFSFKTQLLTLGYQPTASETYSLMPFSGFSAYLFGAVPNLLPSSTQYIQALSQYNLAAPVLLCANISGTTPIAINDGSWRSRTGNPTHNTIPVETADKRLIMSQRKVSGAATDYIDTWRSEYSPQTFRQQITAGDFTAAATTFAIFSQAARFFLSSRITAHAIIHFPFWLSDRDDDLMLGWGAWKYNMVHLLPSEHPFRNRPPLLGD
jgi:hypothetical protein